MIKSRSTAVQWMFLGGILLAWLVWFHRESLLYGKVLHGGDLNYLHYPWKTFILNCFSEGHWPFWNPLTFCGTPFLHDMQTALFYPPDWLYFRLPLPWGFALSFAVHQAWAMAGMVMLSGRYCRTPWGRGLSGLVYAGSGALVTRFWLGNPGVVAALAWLPWFFLCAWRVYETPMVSRVGVLALVSAMLVLTGHPQLPFFAANLLLAALTVDLVAQHRHNTGLKTRLKGVAGLSAAALIALLVTAIQLIPFAELARFSATRGENSGYSLAAEGSMPWSHLVTLLAPFFWGDPTNETFWASLIPYPEISGYLGVTALLLATAAICGNCSRQVVFLLAVTAVTLLLAVGEFGPLHPLVCRVVPGWSLFRQPARVFSIYSLCMALLAGIGLETLQTSFGKPRSPQHQRVWKILLVVVVVLVLLTVVGWLGLFWQGNQILSYFAESQNARISQSAGDFSMRYQPEQFQHRLSAMQTSLGWLLGILVSVLVFGLACWRWSAVQSMGVLAVILIAVELLVFGNRFLVTSSIAEWEDVYYGDDRLISKIQTYAADGRVLIPDTALDYRYRSLYPWLYPNGPMVNNIASIRGYNATILRHYSQFINRIQGYPEQNLPGGLLILDRIEAIPEETLARLNITAMVDFGPPPSGFELVERDPRGGLAIAQAHFQPSLVVRCQPGNRDDERWPALCQNNSKPQWRRIGPNRLQITTTGEGPGLLVVSESWFPGWQATVNQRPVEIELVQKTFMGIPVPDGESRVDLEFVPSHWKLAWGFSLIGLLVLLGCLCGLVWPKRKTVWVILP